jgi:PAS domain S-box-containing protein
MPASRKSKRATTPEKKTKQLKKGPVVKKTNSVSEIYFKTIFENAGIGIVLLDTKRKILNSNRAFQKFMKYSEEELSLLTLKEITHPSDYEVDEKLFEEVAAGKRTDYTIEKRYLTKDGAVVYARVTHSSTFELKRRTMRILAIIEDITRQKHFENKLVSEQNFLDALLENSPDQIYFKDLNSRFLKISAALAKKHNLLVTDLIGKTDFDVFGVAHAADAYKDEQEIIRTGIPIIGKEEREDSDDGRVAWVSTSKMPFYDEEGKLIGTFGISRDITLKKRTEQSHEALFKITKTAFTAPDISSMFKNIHDVVEMLMPAKNFYIALYDEKDDLFSFPYYIDRHNKPRETSKPIKGMTEYVFREGKATLIDRKRFKKLLDAGELEIIGSPPLIWLGVPLKLAGKTIGVMAVQDYENPLCYGESEMQLFAFIAEQIAQVIERKKNTDEISRYAEELKQLNATKDKFFSIIAHDLKNPFITIMGFSDLICSDYYELTDEERIFYIKEMKQSADLSYNLLQNLLQWSRSQTGRIEYNPEKIELAKITRGICNLFKKTAEIKHIHLQNKIEQSVYVTADAEMLNTVLRNLVSNSIKFSNAGGVICIEASTLDNYMEICVSDCGVGMDQKTINSLFRLDVTQSTPGTKKETGTGLGLILCKEFIEKHMGTIHVESEIGKGSKFIFTLPA